MARLDVPKFAHHDGDYALFSPAIAAELEHDDVARLTVLAVIVRPLLAWYTLAGKRLWRRR